MTNETKTDEEIAIEKLVAKMDAMVQTVYGGCCHMMNEAPHPDDVSTVQMQTIYANAFSAACAAAVVALGKGISQTERAKMWDGFITLFIHNLNDKDKILEETVPGHVSINIRPEGTWEVPSNET